MDGIIEEDVSGGKFTAFAIGTPGSKTTHTWPLIIPLGLYCLCDLLCRKYFQVVLVSSQISLLGFGKPYALIDE